ncbi:MAG: hypothetical protein IJK68_05190, partial [Muribaculaceae bacterium]|nr:hypothetical protein [Muribaculaceae bacterium]
MKKTTINLRLLLLVILLIVGVTHGVAVFKERDFGKTIDVLCAELELKYKEQKEIMQRYEQNAKTQHQMLVATMQQIDQISLILYSQSSEFTFDMAYACQQATDLYHNSMVSHVPFNKIMARFDSEIERYDSLIYVLKHISPAITDDDITLLKNSTNSKSSSNKGKASSQPAAEEKNDSLLAIEAVADSIMQSKQATHKNSESLDAPLGEKPKMEIGAQGDRQALYVLNDKEKEIRELCLIYAQALRNNLIRIKNKM